MSEAISRLVKSLARPVTCGLLPIGEAEAAIAVALLRDGTEDIEGDLRTWSHILDLQLRNAEAARDTAYASIRRVLSHMIRARAAWPAMMAEAHNVNGAAGFPLTETEVSRIVSTAVYYALPPAPRRPRYGH